MVFQNYALYPMLTVYDNLSFSLKIRKMKKSVIEQKVNEVAELLGISDLLKRKPRQLSGGQMQRVAIGRAIIRNPKVFLMDEPLSNLDVILNGIQLDGRRNQTLNDLLRESNDAPDVGSSLTIGDLALYVRSMVDNRIITVGIVSQQTTE